MNKHILRVISLLVIIAALVLPLIPQAVYAVDWYNASWDYRKEITVTDASADYQTKIVIGKTSAVSGEDVDCNNHCQDDFDDLRFTEADGTTLVDYWVESVVADAGTFKATVWIQNNSDPETTLYMYYGNAGASSASSGVDTFIVFDDFERGNNGDPIGGDWTINAGDVDISTEQDIGNVTGYFGTRSMKLIGGATAPDVQIVVTHSDSIAVRFELYKENAAYYYFRHGDGTQRITASGEADEDLVYYDDGGLKDTGDNCNADTWDLYELNDFDWTAHTWDWYLNSVSIQNDATMVTNASYSDVFNYLGDATGTRDTYVDNFIVRKWASTEPSFAYGAEEEAPASPTVTTSDATNIEETTATVGGNITDIGSGNATVRGVEYDIDSGAPYANDWHENGNFGTGAYTTGLTSLTKGELYYFRAYATNGDGTGYGTEKTFLTKPDEPTNFTVERTATDEIDLTWTKGSGAQKTVIRGKENSYPANIADGIEVYNDTGTSYTHSGLAYDEEWYYRAWSYATEGALEQYSDTYDEDYDRSPDIITGSCVGFDTTWAILNAEMDEDNGSDIIEYGFDYGLTSATLTSSETSIGDIENGEYFSNKLTPLTPATVYYYQAKAENDGGIGFGSIERFATKGSPAVYEYYITGGNDDSIDIYATNWAYQTFTTGTVAHTVTSIKLYLKRTDSPGNIIVSIRYASGDMPTGVDLVSGSIDGDDISIAYDWYVFEVDETSLMDNTDYAIVVRAVDGDAANYINWQINNAGGYADGVYGTSTNSGTTWTDTADDAIFEIWGNPCIEIQDVKVFEGYKEDNDWLITVRYINLYPPYYDTYDIKKYFVFQLLDTLNVVRAESPLVAWGNRVGNLYMSAAQVGSLEYGEAYTIRVYGNFGSNPYTEYELESTDWQGDDLTNLDSWVITSASVLANYYDTSMTTYIAGRGEVLNSTGGTIFSTGINGLSTVRPNLFQYYTQPYEYDDTEFDQTGMTATWQATVGEDVTAWVTDLGSIVGVDGRAILQILAVAIYICLAVWAFVPNQSIAANLLGLPIIFGAWYFGMNIIFIGVLAIISVFLFIKHFWIDR